MIISAEDFRRVNLEEPALAPCPGPAYSEYYSSVRKYTKRYNKIRKRNRRARLKSCRIRPTPFKSYDKPAAETSDFRQDVLSQYSSACTETGVKHSQDSHHKHIRRFPGAMQQPNIYSSLDSVSCSLETLVSMFHPRT